MLATYNESKVTNAWCSINQCNEKLYFPGQPHSFQGFFQTFPYLWSFSKLFKAWKTSILNSMTFQTFPGSVQTLFTAPHIPTNYTGRNTCNRTARNTKTTHMSNAQYVPLITAQKTLPQWYWHHRSPWQLHAERNGELYQSISSTSKTQQTVCPRNLAINNRNSQDQYTQCEPRCWVIWNKHD